MDDLRLRQTFIDLCEGKVKRDINGVLFGILTAEQVYDLFKLGQLTCAYCGKVLKTRVQLKYHMTCYCEEFNKVHHEGD